MELDLGLSLSPQTNSSKLGFDFDLNKHCAMEGTTCLKEEDCYVPKPPLFATNEEDEDPLEFDSSIVYDEEEKNVIVGWPPVKSCMIKYRSYHHRHIHHYPYHHHHHGRRNSNGMASSSTLSSMYVKVKMDGVAITRKVDIKLFNSYHSLTHSLITMFSHYCDKQEDTNYVFTFQGKEGDWLLPGDVPWMVFAESVHRISIIRDRPCAQHTRLLFQK